MISKLSNRITRKLLKRNIISDEETELYNYGLFMIISYVIFFIVSLLFGIALSIPFSSVLFYISFCLVRNFAGGIHADLEIKCDIITVALIFISEVLIKVFIECNFVIVAFVIQVISSISLCVIKPVASSQKEISQQEKLHFHKEVIVVTVLSLLVSTVSMILGIYSITIALSVGLSLANILLVFGKMQQLRK